MLVLSRKKNEEIVLKIPGREEEVRLTVVRIDSPNKVRLGITAPDDIVILRSELEEKQPQNGSVINLSGVH